MNGDWKLSRRRFLGIAGTSAVGLMFAHNLAAMTNEKPMLRFGMITDVHYADREPGGTRFYRQSLSKVKEAIDKMNAEKLDFAIELGDFKDQDEKPDESRTLKYLSDIESVFQQFNGPTYHVLGNHDMDGISKQQFLERVENTGVSKDKSYYSFTLKGVHFIVLDGNFTKDGKPYDHGNFSWNDAFIPNDEVNWLKDDLKSNELPVVVFVHQMLEESKGKNYAVANAPEVRSILEQSGKVRCVLEGHVHEEIYQQINGIHYYSLNAVIDGDGAENSAYMIVSVFKDGSLMVDGFRRASDRELK